MLRGLGRNKVVAFALAAILVLAIWKINDGSLANFADAVVGFFDAASDAVVEAWNRVT